MQIVFHRRMMCWLLVLLLSGVSAAGVVDDAEEVLTTVRAKEPAVGQAKDGPNVFSSGSTSQGASSLPSTAPRPRARKSRSKGAGRSRSSRSRSVSKSQDDSATRTGAKRPEVGSKGRALNFAGLFLLVALVVAAVTFSNRSGEAH